jgi:hypothetical protein
MGDIEKPGEWTEIRLDEVRYDIEIPDSMFTRSNLRNPR